MYAKNYSVELTGTRPSLMHAHNVEAMSKIDAWRKHPLNKAMSVKGDDRSPAFTWLSYVNHDNGVVGWPSDNLMTMIRDGATMVPAGGKKTFKTQSQSGILVNEILWPLKLGGKEIPWAELAKLDGNTDFSEHVAAMEKLGIKLTKKTSLTLFVKPAKIGANKHIRVRPRFENWTCGGTVTVFDETITKEVLQMIFDCCGRFVGLSDWRPKSPKSPGQFGLFTAKVKPIK